MCPVLLDQNSAATPTARDSEDYIMNLAENLSSFYDELRNNVHRQLSFVPTLLFKLPIYGSSEGEKKRYSGIFHSATLTPNGLRLLIKGTLDQIYDGLLFYKDIFGLNRFYLARPFEFNRFSNCSPQTVFTLLIHPDDVVEVLSNLKKKFFEQFNEEMRRLICKTHGLPATLWDTVDYPSTLSEYLSLYSSDVNLTAFNEEGLTLLHKFVLHFVQQSPTAFYYPENYYTLFKYGSLICFDQYAKYTPLHLHFIKCEQVNTNRKRSKHIAEILISKVTNFQESDYQGNNYLHGAVASHMPLEVIRELFEKGVPFDAKNKAGLRPVDIARDKGRQDVVDYLSNELPNRIMLAKALERQGGAADPSIQVQLSQIVQRLEALGTEVSGRLDRLETKMGSVEMRLNQFESQRNEQPDLAQHPMSLRPSGYKH